MKPGIFEQKFKDGSTFRVSDSFVRKCLHGLLSWSIGKATQAAQKLSVMESLQEDIEFNTGLEDKDAE